MSSRSSKRASAMHTVTGTLLGGPRGGAVPALAIAGAAGSAASQRSIFIGSKVGLYRLDGGKRPSSAPTWVRLPAAPLGIMALAASPNFAHDRALALGTDSGIYLSNDAGASWRAAQVPMAGAMVLSLAFSPNFADDGILLAGTLEDGIWYSEDCGQRWSARNFGLLDGTVFALAFSPRFAEDQRLYAGTDSAVYHSYNGARAWKQLSFPEDAAPVLSLTLAHDATGQCNLYAGTEQRGLLRSCDGGERWQATSLPADNVNAVLFQAKHGLVAAGNGGVWRSKDLGATWQTLGELSEVIGLAADDTDVLAGSLDAGAWIMPASSRTSRSRWRDLGAPPIRSITGLALPPPDRPESFIGLNGRQEGVWGSRDGGASWHSLNENLTSLDVNALRVTATPAGSMQLVVAAADGIHSSDDAGATWQRLAEGEATHLACSADGQEWVAAIAGVGLARSNDQGRSWVSVPGPWEKSGQVVGLAISGAQDLLVATLEGVDDTLSIWYVSPGQLIPVLREVIPERPVVVLRAPDRAADGVWHIGCGQRVWNFDPRDPHPASSQRVFEPSEQREHIVALFSAADRDDAPGLYVCSNKRLYRSKEVANGAAKPMEIGAEAAPRPWETRYDFGEAQVIAFDRRSDTLAYAVLLGGSVYRLDHL